MRLTSRDRLLDLNEFRFCYDGRRRPNFCGAHPVGASAFVFASCDRPSFALQARAFEDGMAPSASAIRSLDIAHVVDSGE